MKQKRAEKSEKARENGYPQKILLPEIVEKTVATVSTVGAQKPATVATVKWALFWKSEKNPLGPSLRMPGIYYLRASPYSFAIKSARPMRFSSWMMRRRSSGLYQKKNMR